MKAAGRHHESRRAARGEALRQLDDAHGMRADSVRGLGIAGLAGPPRAPPRSSSSSPGVRPRAPDGSLAASGPPPGDGTPGSPALGKTAARTRPLAACRRGCAVPSVMVMNDIQVRGLTKRFGSTLAVDRLTFDVSPGIVTGFLGPNGAGKSTTMRMITGRSWFPAT